MQSLLEAVKEKFKEWPDDIQRFTCDPDGEVRGYPLVSNDFYPKNEVDLSERSSDYGYEDGTIVTKENFESI